MLTDTHCHLNSQHFAGRVPEVLARAEEAGVGRIVVPGWDRESSYMALSMASTWPMLRPAVGLHPWFVADDPELVWVSQLVDDPRVVAIGEIGLDGAVEGHEPAMQQEVFRAQLRLAAERNLPVLLHCRRGWDRLLADIRDIPVRGVVHAFSGSREVLQECLHLGLYISFAGMVTRTNSRRAREAAAIVPCDRIVLETDAPYMAMEGIPAEETEPAHLPRVLDYIARLRGESAEALKQEVTKNVARLFGD